MLLAPILPGAKLPGYERKTPRETTRIQGAFHRRNRLCLCTDSISA